MDDGGSIANLMDACMELKQLLRPRSGGEEIKRSIWKEKEQCMHGKGYRLMKRPPGHLARIDSLYVVISPLACCCC